MVLVIARGWRGQATPWAGDRDLQAPNLEAFAKTAIVLTRAYAAYPRSSPALAAIESGRYPHATGTIADGATLARNQSTLASALQAAGFRAGERIGPTDDIAPQSRQSPSFSRVRIEPGRVGRIDDGEFHLRENVPADAAERTRAAVAARYAAYRQMDQEFGKILAAADPANTIVAFTSDAGDLIGSHGLEGDDSFYEESVRIPLAIRIPGVEPTANDMLVSEVDIAPTLLGLCGESLYEGIQGRDLSRLLTTGQGLRPESIYAEGRIGKRDEWRMLVVGVDKIVTDASGEATHVFNLASDPYELRNLVKESELKRAQLLATIRAERSRLLDFRRR